MSQENSDKYKYLIEKLWKSFETSEDCKEKSDNLRQIALLGYTKSKEIGYSTEEAAAILQDGLQDYQEFINQNGKGNIYAEDIRKFLTSLPQIPDLKKFQTNLDIKFFSRELNAEDVRLGIKNKNVEDLFKDFSLSKINETTKSVEKANLKITDNDMKDIFKDFATNQKMDTFESEPSKSTVQIESNPNSSKISKFVINQPTDQLKKLLDPTLVNPQPKPTNIFDSLLNRKPSSNQTDQMVQKRKYGFETSTNLKIAKLYDTSPASMSIETPETDDCNSKNAFRTAFEELQIQNFKKHGTSSVSNQQKQPLFAYGLSKRKGRNVMEKFVSPVPEQQQQQQQQQNQRSPHSSNYRTRSPQRSDKSDSPDSDELIDERLKNIDPKMIEMIKNEIMVNFSALDWDDIAGLEYAKSTIKEAVIWPILRPDIFTGLRRPPRGILLFGPPGTGKTLIGRCIASQSKSTFFSISASSLTSKWIGESEKMVRALFAVASIHQPAVVFIDEIDSILCQRSETEHESSRRLKTEFLIQLDGAATSEDERILIVGATNRPQELDEAARRRLVKRLYIPLPELEARTQILTNLLKTERTNMTGQQIHEIGLLTDGFSGADMKTLCHEASMGPIRSISMKDMNSIQVTDVRPVDFSDFKNALNRVRASVSPDDLNLYIKWDRTYGSGLDR